MKHIIIEGGDRLGKSTLIEGLSKHFNYDNVVIRHFGKPPSIFPEGISPLKFQARCFLKEAHILECIRQLEDDEYYYYENIVIWNRAHLGEYVYGQMFRAQDPLELKEYINNFEINNLLANSRETFLFLLTTNPKFFLSKEDGNSFSKNLEEKTRELKLFNEIFDFSSIDNKLRIEVSDREKFYSKDYILNIVLDFIKFNGIYGTKN